MAFLVEGPSLEPGDSGAGRGVSSCPAMVSSARATPSRPFVFTCIQRHIFSEHMQHQELGLPSSFACVKADTTQSCIRSLDIQEALPHYMRSAFKEGNAAGAPCCLVSVRLKHVHSHNLRGAPGATAFRGSPSWRTT